MQYQFSTLIESEAQKDDNLKIVERYWSSTLGHLVPFCDSFSPAQGVYSQYSVYDHQIDN